MYIFYNIQGSTHDVGLMASSQAQRFPAIRNNERVERVIAVGTQYEFSKAQKIAKYRPKVELCFVETSGEGRKTQGQVQEELRQHLSGRKNTLVFSDVGESGRPYPFEALAAEAKQISPKAAFALLTSRQECAELEAAMAEFVRDRGFDPEKVLPNVDYVFHYTGNEKIFPTMLQLHEDRMNFRGDSERSILVVEDKPNFYSSFLTSLFDINRHRARVLLARTFEQAAGLIEDCKNRFAGAIIDVEFPRQGRLVREASWELVALLRKFDEKVPVVFQSVEQGWLPQGDPRVFSLWKRDPVMLQTLRGIMNDYFGFGDFVFRRPDGAEIARARAFSELFDLLHTIPPESLVYHASHDHFSNWLWLHGHKKAAKDFKPIFSEDPAELRKALIGLLEPYVK